MDVTAAIDIHAVAVGIDLQVTDRKVVDSGRQNPEPAAVANCDITKKHIAAELEADRLVTVAVFVGIVAHQALAEDLPLPHDRDILQVLSPNKAVAPVAMAEILIRGRVRLRKVVLMAGIGGSGDEYGAWVQLQRDIALKMNRER